LWSIRQRNGVHSLADLVRSDLSTEVVAWREPVGVIHGVRAFLPLLTCKEEDISVNTASLSPERCARTFPMPNATGRTLSVSHEEKRGTPQDGSRCKEGDADAPRPGEGGMTTGSCLGEA
jgi:hypothetical protein